MSGRTIAERVLFVGGHTRMGSVQMRCCQIAEAIGASWTSPAKPGSNWHGDEVPEAEIDGRDIFVLVKNYMDRRGLFERGYVIWDVLDDGPPRDYIHAYVTSTRLVAELLGPSRPVYVIPHHHCNTENILLTPSRMRARMLWIGSSLWLPDELIEQGVETHVISSMGHEDLANLYSRADVLINARRFNAKSPGRYWLHTILNSGMKVINAVGFGIPSVTEWEPWVAEVAPGCSLICAPGDAVRTARELLQNGEMYETLRKRCLDAAVMYSLDAVAKMYLQALANMVSTVRHGIDYE